MPQDVVLTEEAIAAWKPFEPHVVWDSERNRVTYYGRQCSIDERDFPHFSLTLLFDRHAEDLVGCMIHGFKDIIIHDEGKPADQRFITYEYENGGHGGFRCRLLRFCAVPALAFYRRVVVDKYFTVLFDEKVSPVGVEIDILNTKSFYE